MPRAARLSPIAGVRHGAGQAVEFRHHKGVTGADRGEGLIQAGALAMGSGQTVVEVDPLGGHTELAQPVALGGEVLLVGRAAGVADKNPGHVRDCNG